LRIKNNTAQCFQCLVTQIEKRRLNWKLKISNAADNADITQQADDLTQTAVFMQNIDLHPPVAHQPAADGGVRMSGVK